jgi:hypothetical protein
LGIVIQQSPTLVVEGHSFLREKLSKIVNALLKNSAADHSGQKNETDAWQGDADLNNVRSLFLDGVPSGLLPKVTGLVPVDIYILWASLSSSRQAKKSTSG